jgi:hypothetical protein
MLTDELVWRPNPVEALFGSLDTQDDRIVIGVFGHSRIYEDLFDRGNARSRATGNHAGLMLYWPEIKRARGRICGAAT